VELQLIIGHVLNRTIYLLIFVFKFNDKIAQISAHFTFSICPLFYMPCNLKSTFSNFMQCGSK
jgi:hypothetical protein